MKKSVSVILLTFCLGSFQSQAKAEETVNTTTAQKQTVSEDMDGYGKFRFGGYGEMLYQNFDYGPYRFGGNGSGSPTDRRGEISVPRFVLALDYKFSPSWILGAEIEFEYGGTGAGVEVEYGENTEYEYEFEKGGEVALEQFHITKVFNKAFSIRAGHMVVPVGLTNTHHEPINFFGATRPEGESTIIPCTWHETGLAVLGEFKGLGYQAMIVSGLDPYGFSSENWIQSGMQSRFEKTQMKNPAYVLRLDYRGIKGLRIGASGYYAPRINGNATNPSTTTKFKGTVLIGSADAEYKGYGVTARANVLYGYVGDATEINKLRPNKYTGYPGTPVAKNAYTWHAEVGYNVGRHFRNRTMLTPYVKYEKYNTMANEQTGTVVSDKRLNVGLVSAGINYSPVPGLVLKADYNHRIIDHGNFNPENTFQIGIAYAGWFWSK